MTVNQEDSITLWREICSNKLLCKTTLILFLNKVRGYIRAPGGTVETFPEDGYPASDPGCWYPRSEVRS